MKSELVKNPEVALHLYADQSAAYGKVAEVMATAQYAELAKITSMTV